MSVTNFLQGIGTLGVLQTGPNPAGGVFFVCSVNGADNQGRIKFPGSPAATTQGSQQGPQVDPNFPLKTLGFALARTKAGRGDIIVLLPGHAETLAANVTCSTDSTSIVGFGQGTERPTFTMAGFSIILSGVGCQLQNVACLMSTAANITGGIQLNGASCVAESCYVSGANVTSIGILMGAAGTIVDNCEVDGTTTGFDQGVKIGVFARCQVTNNNIHGIYATAPINFAGGATSVLIAHNVLRQRSAAVDAVIAGIVTATSGMISDNRFSSVHAATAAAFIAGANVATNTLVIYLQNFGFTGKAGPSSGILIPAVGTIP